MKRGARPKRLRSEGVGENKKMVIPTNLFWLSENQTDWKLKLSVTQCEWLIVDDEAASLPLAFSNFASVVLYKERKEWVPFIV